MMINSRLCRAAQACLLNRCQLDRPHDNVRSSVLVYRLYSPSQSHSSKSHMMSDQMNRVQQQFDNIFFDGSPADLPLPVPLRTTVRPLSCVRQRVGGIGRIPGEGERSNTSALSQRQCGNGIGAVRSYVFVCRGMPILADFASNIYSSPKEPL